VAKHKLGDKVKARHHHDGVKPGTEGRVTKVCEGVFYGVSYPGVPGVCYSPASHVAPAGPPGGGAASPGGASPGGGTSGGGTTAAPAGGGAVTAAWEGLMDRVLGRR
jgi:hypothetical protein